MTTDTTPSSTNAVMQALRRAGAIYARDKATVLALRCFIGGVVIALVLLVADLFVHFSDRFRWIAAIGIVAFLGFSLAVAVWRAYRSRPTLSRIARLLEERNPQLGSKLMNILQLEENTKSVDSSELTKQLAHYAVAQASQQLDSPSLPPLAREPRMKLHAYRCIGALIALVLITLVGGNIAQNQWLRLLDPYGDHPPFSLTLLAITAPQDQTSIIYDQGLTVKVQASGHLPKELFVTMTPLDPAQAAVTLPMMQLEEDMFTCRFENLHHPAALVAHTSDHYSKSKKCHINIQLTPQFSKSRVRVVYPSYTGIKEKTTDFSFRPMQVLMGSSIEFSVQSNRPLGPGTLTFQPSSPDPSTSYPLAPAATADPRTALATMTAEQSGKLIFSLKDETGIPSLETPESAITVTKDAPPVITISAPERDALSVENHKVPLVIDARDDYGISKTRIHIAINGKHQPVKVYPYPTPGSKSNRHQESIDLAALGAKHGDEVTIFAETMDYHPQAQLARTEIRRITVISDEAYKDMLRAQADAAAAAGKYEDLFRDLDRAIERQTEIRKELAELRDQAKKDPADPKLNEALAESVRNQLELNQDLQQLAERMRAMKRQNPVYDFENDLAERLQEMANDIESSAQQNGEDVEKSLEQSDVKQAPSPQTLEEFEKAAQEQADRLNELGKEGDEEVHKPLEDLAKMHELMKDFTQFEQLLDQQRQLTEQSQAYDKDNLTPDDRQGLADIGAKQREIAPKLQELAEKMKRDAEAAKEAAPEAAEQAQEMADQIQEGAMPGMARDAASQMMKGDGNGGHEQAQSLLQEMEKLLGENNGEARQQALQGGVEELLRKNKMKAGDNFRQMMMSRLFRGKGQPNSSALSSSFSSGQAEPLLLGGESMSDSSIASSVSGESDQASTGNGDGPTAQIDRASLAEVDESFSRRTDTTSGASLLLQYENLANAYFRKLTTPPSTPETKSP